MAINYSSDIAALFASKVGTDAAYQVGGTFNISSSLLNGSVATVAIATPGTGYTTVTGIPTLAFSGGGGTGAAGTVSFMKAVSANVTGGSSNPGSSWVTGDTITYTNGVKLTVTASAGAITALAVTTPGSITSATLLATNPTQASTTSVAGTGAVVNVLYGVGATQLSAGGNNYTTVPTVTLSSAGSPTQATATATITTEDANEVNILTLVEVLRAYAAVVGSKSEAKLMANLLQHAAAELGGYGTSSATLATRLQAALMRIYADPRRLHV